LNSARRLIVLALILTVGLVPRLWNLTASPLWCDEGNNAYFATLTPPRLVEMTRLTHDTDPPVHRLALRAWLALVGPSDQNLRLLSVLVSVTTLAILFAWGTRQYGPTEGTLAAGLMALSPMAIFYGREAKGYALVGLLAALGLWLWDAYLADRAPNGRRRGLLWAAYVLCQALMLGTHYYSALLIAAQGAWLVVDWACARGAPEGAHRLWRWLTAQVLAVALVAPWLVLTLDTALHGAQHVPLDREAYGLAQYARVVAVELAAGPAATTPAAAVAVVVLGVAAAWGAFRDGWRRAGPLVAAVIGAVALAYVVQRAYPFFSARFLLFVLAPLCLLAARGLASLRWVGAALGALLLGTWLAVLPATLRQTTYPDQDLRPAARVLRDVALPGDTLITGYIWQEGILRMYVPDVPLRYVLGWYDPAGADAALRAALADGARIWFLSYDAPLQDPGNPAAMWLERNAARALAVQSGGHTLALYLAPCDGVSAGAREASFADGLRLKYDPVAGRVSPGQPVRLDLMWQVEQPPEQPYSAFVHLVDDAGRLWAQADGEPRHGLEPLPHLAPGEAVTDCRAILVPADAPPGRYTILAGLYDPAGGQRVPVLSGGDLSLDYVVLGEVTVAAEVQEY